MSYTEMSKVANNVDAEKDQFVFEYSGELSSPGNGDWILIPNGVNNISVTLSVTAGSGYTYNAGNEEQRKQAEQKAIEQGHAIKADG